ncbi:MAG: DNA repair protein RecO [Oscillospiraceae bacterium]|nr:DNA repair protein RecO [Oscillospiraceae bacterium]
MHMVTHALVLREVNYKESDKILTVLTRENGKMTLSARGCRKKGSAIAAASQLLVWSEMTLYEYQGRWAVKEANTDREFAGVRADLEKLALGCYFAEMAELLTVEDVPAPELLSLLLNSMHALDKMDKPPALVKAAFELKVMCLAGYEPILDACAICGAQPEQPRFHLSEGVLHCASCRDEVGEGISMPLAPAALSAMRHVAYGDPKRLFSFQMDEVSLKQMGDACEAYVLTQLERGFGTLDFYKQMSIHN